MSLFFNTLSKFVIAFLPSSKHLLISWLQSPSPVVLEPKKIKYVTASTFSPYICHEVMAPDVMNILFWMLSFKTAFSLSSFTHIKSLFQFSSVTQSCLTLCNPMNCSMPGLPVHHQLPEFTQICIQRVRDAIQPSHPLLSPSPPAPNPSQHQSLSNESTLRMRWPKYWSFSFSIIPSKEIPGLISFRTDWLDLLAVQGTLKSLLQHHSSKASILQCSAFVTVQLSHPYTTTGKTIALTRRTFVGKVMSLLFTNAV